MQHLTGTYASIPADVNPAFNQCKVKAFKDLSNEATV